MSRLAAIVFALLLRACVADAFNQIITGGGGGGGGGGCSDCASCAPLFCLGGRAGGQTAFGGTGIGDELNLGATSTSPADTHIGVNDLGGARLLVGTDSDPTAILGAGVAQIASFSNALGDDGAFFSTDYIFGSLAFSDNSVAPQFFGIRTRGSAATPAPVVADDILFQLSANGLCSGGLPGKVPTILFKVDGTPGASDMGTAMAFRTTDGLGGAPAYFGLDKDGRVLFAVSPFTLRDAWVRISAIDDTVPTMVVQATSAQTHDVMDWLNSSGSTLVAIAPTGHVTLAGVQPTCGSGCSSIRGSDSAFDVTASSGVVTSVVVNFGATWAHTPVCTTTADTPLAIGLTPTPTMLTFTTLSTVGDGHLYTHCFDPEATTTTTTTSTTTTTT